MAARLVLLLVVALLAACGGDGDDEGDANGTVATTTDTTQGGEALAVRERVLVGDELDGFTAGGPGEWRAVDDFTPHFRLVDPNQLGRRLRAAGFVAAAGNSLVGEGDDTKQGLSFAIQLKSSAAAVRELEWIYGNAAAPCPPGCGVRAVPFAVPIPSSRGVELRAREETQFGAPFTAHRIFFADGPFVYAVVTSGPPGAVERDTVVAAAQALHQRVAGRPPAG